MTTIEEIRKYITKRYERWLDYSTYHCNMQGMAGEEVDVLNEVLLNLLQKPDKQLIKLYEIRSNQYRELDYFILRMIKMNACSNTAPYRHRYRSIPVDGNVDYARLDIEDELGDEEDRAGQILSKMEQVRKAVEDIEPYMDPIDVKAFFFRYFDGEHGANWVGENKKVCYDRAYRVMKEVRSYVANFETRKLKVRSIWYSFAG